MKVWRTIRQFHHPNMLDTLPPEILDIVLSNVPRQELFNTAKTSLYIASRCINLVQAGQDAPIRVRLGTTKRPVRHLLEILYDTRISNVHSEPPIKATH